MEDVRIFRRLLLLLTRRGRERAQPGFPRFEVPPDAPVIPAARIQRCLDEHGIF